ncbi:MAG: alpha/beta fold hydrolase [Chloroflexota bacterium]
MPYVTSAGVPIFYKVVGEGFPVVLHTGGGGDGSMWEQGGYVAGLEGFQRILLDHRGHGRSGKPTTTEAHGKERYVADVITVLDALGIEHAAFWGYSSGAAVGYALASMHPERIVAFVAQGAIGGGDNDTPENQADAERMAQIARERGVGGFVEGAFEAGEVPEWFMEQMRRTDGEMFALQVLGSVTWHGPWSVLGGIKCPVLMLVGEREDPEGDNPSAAAQIANATCVSFPGLGHLGAYVRSDLALGEAIPFLQRAAQGEGVVADS